MIEKQELIKTMAALFQVNRDMAMRVALDSVIGGSDKDKRMALQIDGAAKGIKMLADFLDITDKELEQPVTDEEKEEMLGKIKKKTEDEQREAAKRMVGMILGDGPLGGFKC